MARLSARSAYYIELFVAAFIFVDMATVGAGLLFLSTSLMALECAAALLFVAFVLSYSFALGRAGGEGGTASWLPHALFICIVAAYAAMVIFASPLPFSQYLGRIAKVLTIDTLFFMAFLPLFFLSFLGAYLWRDRRKSLPKSLAALAIFAILIGALLFLYSFRALIVSYAVNDEEMLALQSAVSVVNGTNPYGMSYAYAIYQNPEVGFTATTDNRIVGSMGYPALFFLVLVPFFLAAPPTLANFESVMMPLQSSAFIFILLVALAFSLRRKDLLRPNFMLLAFLVVAMLNISSIQTYLMIALLMVGYAAIDTKYAWVALGLCASMQEELWLPVIFLLVYSANNQGIRKGAMNALGAFAVFLVVNGYFIVQSPRSFFLSLFGTLGGSFFPNGISSVGFVLVKELPLLLSTYPQLFEITALLLGFLLLYWNRKELIPLFSAIPFLVTDKSVSSYYSTFLFLLLFAFCFWEEKRTGGSRES